MIHLTKQTPDRWSLAACAIGAGLYFSSASLGQAQIVRDGTLGPGVAIQPTGPNYVIPDSHGARAGTNLFHSFQQFNIRTGESATFTGPNDIQNVISRVTGSSASTIDGVLRSQVGQANVWLLNPNGVILRQNARIDVPAAFYRNEPGTAELRFKDGTVLNATSSQLSIAPPEAFGFLSHRAPPNTSSQGGGQPIALQAVPAAGGSTNGGTTPGTSTPGGGANRGTTPGASTTGGDTNGGTTEGGIMSSAGKDIRHHRAPVGTDEGTTLGGTTPEGGTNGGTTPGASTPGGGANRGTTPGASTPGGSTNRGTTMRESTPGGSTNRGTTPGGSSRRGSN